MDIYYIKIPEKCPFCNTNLIISNKNGSEFLCCPNELCQCRTLNKIDHFFGKKGLNVKGLSKATIEKLLEWEWVKDISDIFHLKAYSAQWMKKKGFGEKSVENILSAIDSRREITISELLSAAGIPKIGVTVSKKIEEKYPDWDSFKRAIDDNSLIKIDGIGDELFYNLKHYDYSWIEELLVNNELTIVVKDSPIVTYTNNLEGQTVVITGKLQIFKKRADLEQTIKNYGGNIGSSITGKTTILINNDNTSTSKKNLDAKEKGIPIMTEQEFIEKFEVEVS